MTISKRKKISLRKMTVISILAALSALLMLFKINLFFVPPFIKLDLGEVPALIGSFSLGPLYGLVIIAIKNILNILLNGSDSLMIGELSNLIVNGTFVFVAGMIYHHHKSFKQAIIAMIVSTMTMTVVATVSNYFVIFPLYSQVYNLPIEALVSMTHKVNPLVNSYLEMMLFSIVPFNLIKGIVTSLITTILYDHISPILKKQI